MPKSLQQEVNDRGIGYCQVSGDALVPCGYHRDRAHSRPLRVDSAVTRDRNDPTVRHLPSSDDTKKLARSLENSTWPPAGGWYLVKEQREWLRDQVSAYLRQSGKTSLRILEAGAASHVHHATYLIILQEVLDAADVAATIEVVTADRCQMPVLAIEALRSSPDGERISTHGYDIELHSEFSELLRQTKILDDPRITEQALNRDLTDASGIAELGKFDLVTEHFISAVLGNFDLLGNFRATYAQLLRPGGWLLCACGLTLRTNREDYNRFLELNNRHGLVLRKIDGTWDPYGMKREQIEVLLEDRPVQTHLDNTMFLFERVA